jgi:hypothetical protein
MWNAKVGKTEKMAEESVSLHPFTFNLFPLALNAEP